uniref:Uncharacterized protein n=1 Tax=Arion vulgaris TaxID=1028688 RepID=A0A0B7ACP8_9EUPU
MKTSPSASPKAWYKSTAKKPNIVGGKETGGKALFDSTLNLKAIRFSAIELMLSFMPSCKEMMEQFWGTVNNVSVFYKVLVR